MGRFKHYCRLNFQTPSWFQQIPKKADSLVQHQNLSPSLYNKGKISIDSKYVNSALQKKWSHMIDIVAFSSSIRSL